MVNALEVQHAQKTYSDGTVALEDVSLTVKPGEFFALLGLNGAGKTTLIGMIMTLIQMTAGSIRVFGHDLQHVPLEAKTFLGQVPQEPNLNVFETVEAILLNHAGYFGIRRRDALERVTAVLKDMRLTDKRHQRIHRLSGGMVRRVMIARALMHQPRLLILDEPTAGVDVDLRAEVWELLRELNQKGVTVILTTHYMEEVEALCDRVAILHQGRIVREGHVDEIKKMLNQTRYTLILEQPLAQELPCPGVKWHNIEGETVDVTVDSSLAPLMATFAQHGVAVRHAYNKTNRLESYFLEDTKRGEA